MGIYLNASTSEKWIPVKKEYGQSFLADKKIGEISRKSIPLVESNKKNLLEIPLHQKIAFGFSVATLIGSGLSYMGYPFSNDASKLFSAAFQVASCFTLIQDCFDASYARIGFSLLSFSLNYSPLRPFVQGISACSMSYDSYQQSKKSLQLINDKNYTTVVRNVFVYSVNAFSSCHSLFSVLFGNSMNKETKNPSNESLKPKQLFLPEADSSSNTSSGLELNSNLAKNKGEPLRSFPPASLNTNPFSLTFNPLSNLVPTGNTSTGSSWLNLRCFLPDVMSPAVAFPTIPLVNVTSNRKETNAEQLPVVSSTIISTKGSTEVKSFLEQQPKSLIEIKNAFVKALSTKLWEYNLSADEVDQNLCDFFIKNLKNLKLKDQIANDFEWNEADVTEVLVKTKFPESRAKNIWVLIDKKQSGEKAVVKLSPHDKKSMLRINRARLQEYPIPGGKIVSG